MKNYLKFIRQQKQPSTLSLGKQKWGFWIAIISGIGTLFIGIASIVLAVKVEGTAVKIEKMDSLIKTIANQDTTLVRITKQNSESIGKLDSILKELYHQYKVQTTNTEPKIKLLDPITERISQNLLHFQLPFTNTGSRDAVKLDIEVYLIYDDGKIVKTELTNMLNHKDMICTPGQTQNVEFNINLDSNLIKNLSFRYKFRYLDKLTSLPYEQTFHFVYEWKNDKVTIQRYNATAYAKTMDSLITAINKKPKKKVLPVDHHHGNTD